MTRDEFFMDVTEMLRLLAQLGLPEALQSEAAGKVAAMKAEGRGFTPDDLRRYADAIDWAPQDDARVLADLARALLRIVVGLGSELETFRRASG